MERSLGEAWEESGIVAGTMAQVFLCELNSIGAVH